MFPLQYIANPVTIARAATTATIIPAMAPPFNPLESLLLKYLYVFDFPAGFVASVELSEEVGVL